MQGAKENRKIEYSYLRAMAAIAIVLLHTCQYNVEHFSVSGMDKILSVVIRNSMLWAVPVFVMVTGALLLDTSRSLPYRKLFGRYVLRDILLILVCVVGSQLLDQRILGLETPESFGHSLAVVITAQGWQTFWYLYLLLAIYLSLPALRSMARGMVGSDLSYLLAVLFLVQAVLPFFYHILGANVGVYLLFYTVYPLYLFLGYALRNIRLQNAVLPWITVTVCVGVEIFLAVGCFVNGWSTLIGEIERYSCPIIVLESVGIFLICVQWAWKQTCGRVGRLLLVIDRFTLDIYLIHLFLLQISIHGMHFDPYQYGLWMVLLEAAVLFALSFLTAWLGHGIVRYLKRKISVLVYKKIPGKYAR